MSLPSTNLELTPGDREGSTWRGSLVGELDLAAVARIAEQVEQVPAASPLTLDLSGVSFADLAGIRLLERLATRSAGCDLKDVPAAIRRVVDLVESPVLVPLLAAKGPAIARCPVCRREWASASGLRLTRKLGCLVCGSTIEVSVGATGIERVGPRLRKGARSDLADDRVEPPPGEL